jgi:hypothetical protein
MSNKVIDKVRADLDYRTPQGGKPLGHIVLDRAAAEQLCQEHAALVEMLEETRAWLDALALGQKDDDVAATDDQIARIDSVLTGE